MHAVAAADEYVLAGHVTHSGTDSESLSLSVLDGSVASELVASVSLVAASTAQPEYVPAAHCVQPVEPAAAMLPGAHAVQLDAPKAE